MLIMLSLQLKTFCLNLSVCYVFQQVWSSKDHADILTILSPSILSSSQSSTIMMAQIMGPFTVDLLQRLASYFLNMWVLDNIIYYYQSIVATI